ncbi:hypothetical protein [Treponema pedis]|uniref:hypothetical protein n=1 Tax=Treponema pedis TaxID=409322 RepID=UPI0031342184
MEFTVDNLNILAENYKSAKTQNLRDELTMKIFTVMYFNLEKLGVIIGDEDKRNDFLLEFYKKIPSTLKCFNPNFSSFKTYLITRLKYAAINFISELRNARIKEEVLKNEEQYRMNIIAEDLENEGYYTFYASENTVPYKKDDMKKNFKEVSLRTVYAGMNIYQRRIFLLTCKACLFLDDNMIKKISKEINMPFRLLFDIVHSFKNECVRCKENIKEINYKRNKYYIKLKVFENLLKITEKDYQSYAKLTRSYKANVRFFYKAKEISDKQVKGPSNAAIGRRLNLGRGTVDKNIYTSLKNGITAKNTGTSF